MADATLSALIDSFLQETSDATQKANILTFLGIGSSDSPTFAGLTITGGTITSSAPASLTQTWNASGVTFTGLKLNITNTASASGSMLIDLQIGDVSKFKVDPNGYATCERLYLDATRYFDIAIGNIFCRSDFGVQGAVWMFSNTGRLAIGTSGYGDVFWGRAAAATWQAGENHATTATHQTIKAHDVTAGNGSDLTLTGGSGGGGGSDGAVVLGDGGGLAFLDSSARAEAGTWNLPEVYAALFNHGALVPPANSFSNITGGETSGSFDIVLNSMNGQGIAWTIEIQTSLDDATWSSATNASETGSGGTLGAVTVSGLIADTLYYVRCRSRAAGNANVYGAWSASQSGTTTA